MEQKKWYIFDENKDKEYILDLQERHAVILLANKVFPNKELDKVNLGE